MRRELLSTLCVVAAVVALGALGPGLVREIGTLPRARVLAARADQRVVMLEIGGMTCSGCAAKVKSELVALSGVSTAEVRLGQQRAYVVCEKSLPDSLLTAAVHHAGPGFLASVATR